MINFVCFNNTNPFYPVKPGIVPISRIEGPIGAFNFPLIQANALTIHKSQGPTYTEEVYFDFGKSDTSGLVFTGLTRIKRENQVSIKPMDFERVSKINDDVYSVRRRDDLRWQASLKFSFRKLKCLSNIRYYKYKYKFIFIYLLCSFPIRCT